MFENIRNGVDAKLFVYEENATNICGKQINLQKIIKNTFFKNNNDNNSNCILINIESDKERYDRSLQEFKKISLSNFCHLKATYWKNRNDFITDLQNIFYYLQKFNNKITLPIGGININEFSEINDPDIFIQDGPLACYCSHVRALMYGLDNFNDYTIIVEDDISITNTENIEKYLPCIPDDWDIIFLNSAPKNHDYGNKPYYKFVDEFHSGQFYIVRNSCIKTLFDNLYPITDQVDVLISDLHKQLNIYNIVDTVYQRNISTNTQNNLHVIFNSPHYNILRTHIQNIKDVLNSFINTELPDNEINNNNIISNLLNDILYSHISRVDTDNNKYKSQFDNNIEINNNPKLLQLLNSIEVVIKCSKKGINTSVVSLSLTNNIINTIRIFKKYHNVNNQKYNEKFKAFNYGSSAHTYILEKQQIIIKSYDDELRWKTIDHDNIDEIYMKELFILKKINSSVSYNEHERILYLDYLGESLYDSFSLPYDWKTQISSIFSELTAKNIYYPEFNIKNILNKNSKLYFIDFGLASIVDDVDNSKNCENFIELLGILENRFENVKHNEKLILYNTFINNIKVHKTEKYLKNIF
jgi:GR25 family glycosyltransferase involved in LPS biosynthesis